MAYEKKSRNSAELSELRRQASLSRKSFRGGSRKMPDGYVRPGRSVKIRPDNYDRLAEIAHGKHISISETINLVLERHDRIENEKIRPRGLMWKDEYEDLQREKAAQAAQENA